jgi:glycine/D-amino acid oxidase-like deaminating enzyme
MSSQKSASQHFDVVVIGSGVTGLAARMHLETIGAGSVALSHSTNLASTSRLAAGFLSGGQTDNFTRVSHAHGADFAAALWRFGDTAFDATLTFCKEHGVRVASGRRVRLITSEAELVEAERAVRELETHGLDAALHDAPSGHPLAGELSPRVLGVQDDGPRGAVIDTPALLETLLRAGSSPSLAPVAAIEDKGSRLSLRLTDGSHVSCEVAVVATHLAIGSLIPELKPALVSFADQWNPVCLATGADAHAWSKPGIVYSANHTYEWGAVTGKSSFVLGGGRYLRPWAGIEAERAEVDEAITKHLLGQFRKTFAFGATVESAGPAQALLDCRPCDELPVIGPMYGNGRLLLATGYMGQGLTTGLLAGKCLAELIANGKAPELPRRLWPERLRSLET